MDRAPTTASGLDPTRPEPEPVPQAGPRHLSSGSVERALAARLHETLGRDLVYRFRVLPGDRGFDYVSPTCLAMTGYSQDEFYADADIINRLVHPDDAERLGQLSLSPMPTGEVMRWVRKDGTTLWTEHRSSVVPGTAGPVAVEGIVKDVSDLSSARQLVMVVDQSARRFAAHAPDLAVLIDPLGRVVYANEALLALTGWSADEVSLRRWSTTFLHPDDLRAGRGLLNAVEDGPGETTASLLLRDGRRRDIRWSTLAIPDPRVRRPSILALGKDLSAEHERIAELAQLRTAIGETSDSVVVTDVMAQITSVNPAFERATGYQSAQVVGQNPRILQSGHQAPAFYKSMWWLLTHGHVWRGELINRRADGGLLVEEASITPIRDEGGAVEAFVAVKRDVTGLRELRGNLDDVGRQRERLADAIDRLTVGDSVDATADGIVAMLAELPHVVAAAIGVVDAEGSGHCAASRGMGSLGFNRGDPLGAGVISRLAQHVADPWVEASAGWVSRARADALRRAGLGAIVHIPVYRAELPLGVIIVCGSDENGADILGQVASLNEVTSVMRALLGPGASNRQARQDARTRFGQIIEESAYETVFQPIVDLVNGRRAGFEALTRFSDGTPPALMFAGAGVCGMLHQLELATLRSALTAAEELPGDAWLSLNVSASLLAAEPALVELLEGAGRELVIEILDVAGVEEAQAARQALHGMNVTARLAVDDSGNGAVKPRNLVEMQPDFVKLDISLIHDIDRDPHRQQLTQGLKVFAHAAGALLIAEGVETEAEREELSRLGVPFGQGYYFGPPAPASSWGGR